ncbi:unnamed protein product [Taenia asiatica]|uniref:UmuC domain-containing protein n=1 Tax=Taenia asiatica TaxID=60517 RepID=A0A0R3W6D1_TAEAS|nr:unnamed protein product [Taenia asiatica]
MDRITLLIDMDCFYVQVEQKTRPETVGLPCAVIQPFGCRIIAVSYEARDKGVLRSMNGDAAKAQCPDLLLFQVPMRRGKADLTRYRDASVEVIKSISRFTSNIERASIDEAYIDATGINISYLISSDMSGSTISLEKSNVVIDPDSMKHLCDTGNLPNPPYSCPIIEISGQLDAIERLCDGQKLKQALCLAQKIKDQILTDTGFRCSIGVSPNRVFDNSCFSHKFPSKPFHRIQSAQHLMNFTKVKKVGSSRFSTWLYELCRGRDYQAVSVRTLVKSIACSKNFIGKAALKKDDEILLWLTNLAGEIVERVAIDRANHNRLPTTLSIFLQEETETQIAKRIAEMAYGAVRGLVGAAPITNISLSVGKFKSDHSAACGDVKKLLSEPAKPVKRESFFRQFIESRDEGEPSTPKKVAGEASPHQATESKAQGEAKTSKELVYFQRHNPMADKILCEECGSYVLVHLMPEHKDFHFARRLQQEWNKELNQTSQPLQVKKEIKTIHGVRRGRGRGKKNFGLAKIDTYFVKKD